MDQNRLGLQLQSLRKARNLSQKEVAAKIGVSAQSISKWESGTRTPQMETICRLAGFYNVSVDELLSPQTSFANQHISKIVITGGPCAGKTTAMSWIQNEFTKKGYTVLFIPESATELMGAGVTPESCGSSNDYQLCQMKLQLAKEQIFEEAARTMDAQKILIVCDRGFMDNLAYMTREDFDAQLAILEKNEVELRDSYDAVFHLVSAAKGAEDYYTTSNNTVRYESLEEAAATDDRLIQAWMGHPHFRIIENIAGFEEKMQHLLAEISSYLGEPNPLEIEKKFLIRYPDVEWLEKECQAAKVEIIQTYLQSSPKDEVRVRQRGANGHYIYSKTTRKDIGGEHRIELEERLSEKQYIRLLMDADTKLRPIRKTRYFLNHNARAFEIDLYPFWNDQAIVEVRLRTPDETIDFPEGLEILREVTRDPQYADASLARQLPEKTAI